MSKINKVPVIVQQMIEDVKDPRISANVKHNKVQVLEATRDCCDEAIARWNKEQGR